ncbi:MAG: Stk1 family PASTA domain-containing Ser/Thr kinase [Oscillospiraceae bacterium]|nr:Stk1 family PASTA domain-containing Ser/Thr kinase [Oscillospiraceae bacterium]
MDQFIGKMLDNRYELLELIGRGGMANVYKAKCHRLNRLVAVKILKSDLAENAEFRRRFRDESLAVAQLSHANIVSVYDVSKSDELDYIVMELIDGITLKQYMERRGKMDWRESLHFITQIMRGLSHAHSRGIIHRDIKPQNIMVLRDGSVKVADFGIACLAGAGQTLTQEALGSVHYISPEQARGDRTDERSDIYSAGVVLYEMLTGRLPFEGDSAVSVAIQHLSAIPLAPREINPEIPEGLELITMKAMNADPDKRYASADAMLEDLERFRKDPNTDMEYIRAELNEPVVDEPTEPIPSHRPSAHMQKNEKAGLKNMTQQDKKRMAIILGGFAAALVVIFVLFKIILGGMGGDTERSDSYEVPNVVGYTIEQAMNLPGVKDVFTIEQVGTRINSKYKPGQIVEQDPSAGRTRKSNLVISVFICAEEETASMPTLASMGLQEAKVQLTNLNMDLDVKVVEEYSDTVAQGLVIGTSPTAGSQLKRGDSVSVRISKGKELKPVTVIDFTNQSLEIAQKQAEQLGLKVDVAYDNSVPADSSKTVLEQSLRVGDTVSEGTTVVFTVGGGAKTIEVRNYYGWTSKAAEDDIKNSGLYVSVEEVESSDSAPGTVIGQSIEPGEAVVEGSQITIRVAKAPANPDNPGGDNPGGGDQPGGGESGGETGGEGGQG